MSKTPSQPINKEIASAVGLAGLVCALTLYVLISVVPGLIEILGPVKSGIQTDPIDRTTVNAAIQLIGQK